MNDIQEKKGSGAATWRTIFLIAAIVFLAGDVYLFLNLQKTKKNLDNQIVTTDQVLGEKQKLLVKLQNLEIDYDELSAEYDDLDSLFSVEKEMVQQLKKEVMAAKGNAKEYKNKVAELEFRLQEYQARIAELELKNEELVAENIVIKGNLDSAMMANEELSSENLDLQGQVEMGSMLRAFDLIAEGYKVKSRGDIPTRKAKRVEKIQVCFFIGANQIAEEGMKTVYLRIARPDGEILTGPKENAGMFEFEGKDIAYSAIAEVDYKKKDIDVCISYDKEEEYQKGSYEVYLFVDGYSMGTSGFVLE